MNGRSRGVFNAILAGALQAAVFVAMAVVFADRVPLLVEAGPNSTWGAASIDGAFGGVRRLELALGWRSIAAVSDMNGEAKEGWLRAFEARPEVDLETGMPIANPDAGPTRPSTWPIEGAFTPWLRPASALVTLRGLKLFEKKTTTTAMTLDPLTLAVDRDRGAILLVLVAAFVAARLTALASRLGPVDGSLGHRLRFGAGRGLLGALFSYAAAAAAFVAFAPRLSPEWADYFAALAKAPGYEPYDLLNPENTRALISGFILCAWISMFAWAMSKPRPTPTA